MYIDVKNTVWERIFLGDLTEEKQNVLISKLMEYDRNVYDILNEAGIDFVDAETIKETEAQMTLPENDYDSTVEVYDDELNPKIIFQNGN